MRASFMVAVLVTGCSFDVIGTNVGGPNGGNQSGPAPTPSQPAPTASDGGAPPEQPQPPGNPAPPADMAQQRIGTACTTDPQCDPGLVCATSFGVGPGHVNVPGGYCTLDCSKSACPTNSVCVTFTFGKFCESTCPPDPCRTGYTCCTIPDVDANACTPSQLCPKS